MPCRTRPERFALALVVCVLIVAGSLPAAGPGTSPVVGLRDNTPAVHALAGARIFVEPGQVIDGGTVVLRGGVVEAVLAADAPAAAIPADARVWDLKGKTIYPGLIDAYSEVAIAKDANPAGAPHWNELVQPQRNAANHYQLDKALHKAFREQGVTARLVVPADGVIKGTSALVTTGDQEGSEAIVRDRVALHVHLTVPRERHDDHQHFPNSPMGAVALARQTLYDAQWYAQAWQAYGADRRLSRPERNDALAALGDYVRGDRLVIADTPHELFALRADRFAREFALNLALRGSGEEYRRLEAVRATGRPVIVPVNFPAPPNVSTPEDALSVSLTRMMHWDLAPENPARLEQAGIEMALTAHGLKDRGKFLAGVRTAVERGLSREAALRALTTTPARLLGAADRMGALRAGMAANLLVADGDLFDKKTKLLDVWVDGQRYEINATPTIDVKGVWQVKCEGSGGKKPADLTIAIFGQPEKLAGSVTTADAGKLAGNGKAGGNGGGNGNSTEKDEKAIALSRLRFSQGRLTGDFDGKSLGAEGQVRFSAVIIADADGEVGWLGTLYWPDGRTANLTALRRAAGDAEEENGGDGNGNVAKSPADGKEEKTQIDRNASFPVNYPLGAYGRNGPPDQPELLMFQNATVWSCAEAGVLKDASVLIGRGKILAVGRDLPVPGGAVVIDAKGKHLSPGIIDCHSHMATDGGVNESTQAVTAEVRIGDFIDSDDINIYRQLAGGVTTSNILHGSANPIGGQNQVIKLRWGALPEEMKMPQAPAGIKFALGENVKQSNWPGVRNLRYPQTRMGVEQVIRDEFAAAREYRDRWETFNRTHQGLPPRRDLELDAMVEVLAGKRWIHCHSYRQDEILAMLRTLEDFGVTIGTLQHILEGYKVADAMAQHGAMGSAFSDWWAYKLEVYDAIPYNGALMHQNGVVVSFNSDDTELARHLNHEAAKAVKYGNVPPAEALKFVTLNPARQLRIDAQVGSLAVGKDADLVVWSDEPLSILARCEQTWIDGRKYFDRQEDQTAREQIEAMRAALVQKILASGEEFASADEHPERESDLWPRHDEFCHAHQHDGE